MGSDSSSLNERRRLDDEAELQQWFAALDRQSPPVRPEFLAALRDTCRQELALRRTASGVPFWQRLFAPDQRAGTPHGGFGWRPALVATCVALVVLFAAAFGADLLQSSNSARVATLTVRAGEVDVARPVRFFVDTGLTRELSALPDTSLRLRPGDEIASNQAADAEIALPDGSQIALGPGTELTIEELQVRTASRPLVVAMRLDRGEVRSQVERLSPEGGERFEVSTPNLVAHVKGTIFRVKVQSEGTRVATDKGLVRVSMGNQAFDVEAGRELLVRLGQSVPEVNVRPQPPSIASTALVRGVEDDEATSERYYVNTAVVPWVIRTTPRAHVTFLVNDGVFQELVADDNGVAAVDFVPGSEGTYRITATMETPTGEKSMAAPEMTVVVDYTNPALLLTGPSEPQVTTSAVILEGVTEPGVELLVNDRNVPVDEKGDFSHELVLGVGANPITLVATDPAGNTITLQSVIVYEPPAQR